MNVELVGWYGGDETHALSAWTSTRREIDPERRARIGDLLTMLAQSDPPHTTPFEKSLLHFVVRVEDATHIQTLKHRVAVSVNGESARYKQLRALSHHVPDDWPRIWQQRLDAHARESEALYERALVDLERTLGRKRAKESARFFLTKANELTLDVSFNFHSFMHFIRLRADEAAQREVQQVANRMLELVRGTGAFDLSLVAYGRG